MAAGIRVEGNIRHAICSVKEMPLNYSPLNSPSSLGHDMTLTVMPMTKSLAVGDAHSLTCKGRKKNAAPVCILQRKHSVTTTPIRMLMSFVQILRTKPLSGKRPKTFSFFPLESPRKTPQQTLQIFLTSNRIIQTIKRPRCGSRRCITRHYFTLGN